MERTPTRHVEHSKNTVKTTTESKTHFPLGPFQKQTLTKCDAPGEELVVRPVDGVAALEGDDVLPGGEGGADLLGGSALELADGQLEADDLSAEVVLAALHGDHLDGGVLDGRGAVAVLGLEDLVGHPLGLDLHGTDLLALVGEEHPVADLHVLRVGVVDDGQTWRADRRGRVGVARSGMGEKRRARRMDETSHVKGCRIEREYPILVEKAWGHRCRKSIARNAYRR